MPLQERRGERSRTVCSCDLENSNLDSPLEFRWVFRWLQEQTPATAMAELFSCRDIKYVGVQNIEPLHILYPCWDDPFPDHPSRCTKYIAISPFPFAWIMPRGVNTNPGVSLMC